MTNTTQNPVAINPAQDLRERMVVLKNRLFIWMVLVIMASWLLPAKLVLCEELPPQTTVDRTDFPTLYLAADQLHGEAVWMLQARLKELGYEIETTGVYDQATSQIVEMYQVANNLPVTGQVAQVDWESLLLPEAAEPVTTQGENKPRISIVIDVTKHSLTLYSDKEPIRQYPVGVGKSSTPTPLGEWKVVHKAYNWGNGFGTRWMGLNVPWGVFGIHGTNKPGSIGYSQSHGCIRMRNKDVEALFPLVPMGTRVKIVENGQIFPRNFGGATLKIKSSGQNVVYLQNRLKEKGIIFDIADGRYGAMTELAVKYYQAWHGLEPTGIADTATYRSLGMIK